MELLHPIFKWLHIIAGITWIGLLYFFNFINGHVAATMDGDWFRIDADGNVFHHVRVESGWNTMNL